MKTKTGGLGGSERSDRQRYDLPPAYRRIVGAPPICGPGDHVAAARFADQVRTALQSPGWTTSERRTLKRWLQVWTRRAAGKDVQFEREGYRGASASARVQAKWREKVQTVQVRKG